MPNTPQLSSPLYVEINAVGFCTTISNLNQLGYFHSHDFYEIFLVTQGSAKHFVNDEYFDLVKGSLVFMRPSDEHCYKEPISQNFEFVNIIITQQVINTLINYLGAGFPKESLLDAKFPYQRDLAITSFEPLLSRLKRLISFPKLNIDQYNTVFKLAIANIVTYFVSNKLFDQITPYPDWLKKTIAEMYKAKNYSRGTKALYEIGNCTPEHLSRSFRKYLDMTPSQFVNKIRIEEATRYLIYTNMPIVEISNDIGFDSLSHFYHLFKKQYNCSPLNYRKRSMQSPTE